jgi:Cu+-exporting ATPase
MTKTYQVQGMSCATCAKSIETYLETTKGVSQAKVNYANESLYLDFDDSIITIKEIEDIVDELGYKLIVEEENLNKLLFDVKGMSCSSCARAIETTLTPINGINSVNVNVVNNQMTLEYDPSFIKISRVQKIIGDLGYELAINNSEADMSEEDLLVRKTKKNLLITVSLAATVMTLMIINMFVWSIPGYLYIIALLGFPVVFVFGYKVHKRSWKSLLMKKPNMDVLVSLGSLPPYLVGLLGLFLPITTFIEMATMIMTLHLVGKYLETKAKGKASEAIKKLIDISAKTARIIIDQEEVEVLTSELTVGDTMIIRPGEKIPMDGVVIEGESLVDESIATGESVPVKRRKGDNVIGATINKNGLLKVKVTKVGNDTFLAQVIKLVESCQGSKVPIQEFADRITGIFVPIIMILTALTFISFNVFTDFHLGILNYMEKILPWINTDQSPLSLAFVTATAVLVIACPCALGLGTPTALMVGSGIGANNGILIRSGESVQTFKDIKAIAFDKTGTLTQGRPEVTDIIGENQKEILQIAASLEKGSEHILAQAILQKAEEQKIKIIDSKAFEAVSGLGVKALIKEQEYFLGSSKYFQNLNIDYTSFKDDINRLETEAKTVVLLGAQSQVLGLLAISDDLKPDVKNVIDSLHSMGIKTIMITGDNQLTAQAIAKKASIDEFIAEVMPDGKVEAIKKLQDEYGLVAMVGDGINDAPALKQANVGIALGTGTDIAIESSDITLVSGDLRAVVKAIALSKAIFLKIKQNYFWAWFYNAIAIPFAMLGLLHPMIGAAAMSLSSLNVIYNSLRLKKVNLNKKMEVLNEA